MTTQYSFANIAKAVAAFVVTLGGTAAVLLADEGFSASGPPWLIALLGTLVSAGIVAGVVFKVPNLATPEQVVKGAIAGGEVVVDQVVKQAQDAGIPVPQVVTQNIGHVIETAKKLPDVTDRDAVEQFLRGLR